MREHTIDSSLLDKAIIFAVHAHADSERKGKNLPYIVHPLEAVSIVASITCDQEILAAAVLHDTVEDTATTIEQVRNEFGSRVAELVFYETGPDDKSIPWRIRKQVQVDLLTAASRDCKMVAMGDKLSNMRAIASDYRQLGDRLWSRFRAPNGKIDMAWYYRKLAIALDDLVGLDPFTEFTSLIQEVFGTQESTEE